MDIVPPKKGAFTIETPEHVPKLHTLMMLSARRGGGKSVAISNYVQMLKREKLIDRVILITPTYHSNKEIWEPLNLREEDILEPHKEVLKHVKNVIDAERAEWDAFLANKEKWFEIVNSDRPISSYPAGFLQSLIENKFLEPKWKYELEVPSRLFMIIDDCMGTDLYKPSAGLTRFIIAHRHWGKGLGISVAMLVQTYKGKEGVARPIRENCCLLCLWKLKDMNQLKAIHEEIGSDIMLDKFNEIFTRATEKPFGFLTIDFSAKRPEYTFRSNFNEYLT